MRRGVGEPVEQLLEAAAGERRTVPGDGAVHGQDGPGQQLAVGVVQFGSRAVDRLADSLGDSAQCTTLFLATVLRQVACFAPPQDG